MHLLRSIDDSNGYTVGLKASKLMDLVKGKYLVPDFVTIPHETIVEIMSNNESIFDLVSEILKLVSANRYAVRSAAIAEDTKHSSMAGQFMTKVDVSVNELADAIMEVAEDVLRKQGEALRFSIIVQVFVEPEVAGVLFTRNSSGERNVVVEYREGRGVGVVEGEVVTHLSLLPAETGLYKNQLPFIDDLIKIGREIEARYDWPQDIEWAYKGGTVYILQTRPVTTISEPQWKGVKCLEQKLSIQGNYIYRQTAVSETFSRPRPLAFSILNKIYGEGGPIQFVYERFGVAYVAREQFILFGNELYTNMQSEIQTIFPSYGYLKYKELVPRREHWSGFMMTIKNQFHLFRLPITRVDALQSKMIDLLTKPMDTGSLTDRISFFFKNYSYIFEVSLCTEKALQQLELLAGKNFINTIEQTVFPNNSQSQKIIRNAGLPVGESIGNSLSIDDRSPFVCHLPNDGEVSIDDYQLKNVSPLKRQAVRKAAITTSKYLFVRELSRLAGIRMMNNVREKIDELGQITSSDDPTLIYYASLSEIEEGKMEVPMLKSRKEIYEANSNLQFPSVIASFTQLSKENKTQSIAPGQAEGVVVTTNEVEKVQGQKVLLTDMLTPDLTKYFPNIVGIVAKQGGTLSHLAIMAREAGVPVVVTTLSVKAGEKVFLDGSKGEIVFRR